MLPAFPALTGDVVTERHAQICRERGHAVHTVDGVDSDMCPRCGEPTRAEERPECGASLSANCFRGERGCRVHPSPETRRMIGSVAREAEGRRMRLRIVDKPMPVELIGATDNLLRMNFRTVEEAARWLKMDEYPHFNKSEQVWPGIPGITKALEKNRRGWHVWVNGESRGYFEHMTLKDACHHFYARHGAKLASVTGNGLSFATSDPREIFA